MEKRGITSVMITVLIIVLLLVISVLVYFFFFGPPVEEGECGVGVGWKIVTINNKEDFCYNPQKKEVRFTIENGLVTSLEGVYVKIKSQEMEDDLLLDKVKIEKAGAFVGKIPVGILKDGQLQVIQLLPVVLVNEEKLACLDDTLERKQIGLC